MEDDGTRKGGSQLPFMSYCVSSTILYIIYFFNNPVRWVSFTILYEKFESHRSNLSKVTG